MAIVFDTVPALEFEYGWFHIPSGKSGIKTIKAMTYQDALATINSWNMQFRGPANHEWKYWVIGIKAKG